METFFIADPHFGHKPIIGYEDRPFSTVEQMDEALIENWNRVVRKEDRVFLLGDLSFYQRDKTTAIVQRLRGQKHLILGNHDNKNVKRYYEMGFHRVYDLPVILDGFWIISHEPQPYMNEHMPYADIFGHVHGNKAYTTHSGYSFCVSAERISYTPISFDEIKRLMGIGDANDEEEE